MRTLRHRSRFERDLQEELRFHLERRADDLARAGLSREAAIRRARLEFGNPDVYRDECRQSAGLRLLDELTTDVRYAIRSIHKHALLSAIIVVTLTSGIGISTGVFTLIEAITMRPRVAHDPASFVNVFTSPTSDQTRRRRVGVSTLDEYLAFREAQSLQSLAGYQRVDASVGIGDGLRARVLVVTCDFFPVYGPEPAALGRLLQPHDCSGESSVVVLSDELWRQRLGADPTILGKSLRINGRPLTVVGVARERVASQVDGSLAWVPYTLRASLGIGAVHASGAALERWLDLVGRLAPGRSREQAATELQGLAVQQDRLHSGRSTSVVVTDSAPIHDPGAARSIVPLVSFLMGVLMCLVLIACANVATLMLARAETRHREIAVRLSLGAGRGRLVRMLLTETLLLASAAGAASVYFAYRIPVTLTAWLIDRPLEYSLDPDWRAFAFLAMLSLAAGVAAGLAPASESLRVDVVESLKHRRGLLATMGRPAIARSGLVTSQVALSLVLLMGTGVFVAEHYRLRRLSPGFETRHMLVPRILRTDSTSVPDSSTEQLRRITAALPAIPAVRTLAFAAALPISPSRTADARTASEAPRRTSINEVSPGFFRALDIPILAGRGLSDTDIPCGLSTCHVVISEACARKFFAGRDAVGQSLTTDGMVIQVVGIAANTSSQFARATSFDDGAMIYLPWSPNDAAKSYQLLVRFNGDERPAATAVGALLRQQFPGALVETRTLQSMIDQGIEEFWRLEILVIIIGAIAAVLAIMGVYGVVSFAVARRTREFGIRIALGATRRQVFGTVLGSNLRPVALGLVSGTGLTLLTAAAMTKATMGARLGVDPFNPRAYLAVGAMLSLVIAIAMLLPARRATLVAPIDALREE